MPVIKLEHGEVDTEHQLSSDLRKRLASARLAAPYLLAGLLDRFGPTQPSASPQALEHRLDVALTDPRRTEFGLTNQRLTSCPFALRTRLASNRLQRDEYSKKDYTLEDWSRLILQANWLTRNGRQ